MSSNLYGVANAQGAPQGISLGGNVNCPAGVETVVIQSNPLIAPTPGQFSVLITGLMAVFYGATPPTAINWGVRFNGGSDIILLQWGPATQAAGAWQLLPICVCLGPYSSQWQAPGSAMQITCLPSGSAVTANQYSCISYFTLIRSPDA